VANGKTVWMRHLAPTPCTRGAVYWDEELGFALLADRSGIVTLEEELFRKCLSWWSEEGDAGGGDAGVSARGGLVDSTPRITDEWLRRKLATMQGAVGDGGGASAHGSGAGDGAGGDGGAGGLIPGLLTHRRVSSADPVKDRAIDWGTFCSVIALLQASGVYKAVVRNLILEQKRRRAMAAALREGSADAAAGGPTGGVREAVADGTMIGVPLASLAGRSRAASTGGPGTGIGVTTAAGPSSIRASRRSLHTEVAPAGGGRPAIAAALTSPTAAIAAGAVGSGTAGMAAFSASPNMGRRRSLGSAVYGHSMGPAAFAAVGGVVATLRSGSQPHGGLTALPLGLAGTKGLVAAGRPGLSLPLAHLSTLSGGFASGPASARSATASDATAMGWDVLASGGALPSSRSAAAASSVSPAGHGQGSRGGRHSGGSAAGRDARLALGSMPLTAVQERGGGSATSRSAAGTEGTGTSRADVEPVTDVDRLLTRRDGGEGATGAGARSTVTAAASPDGVAMRSATAGSSHSDRPSLASVSSEGAFGSTAAPVSAARQPGQSPPAPPPLPIRSPVAGGIGGGGGGGGAQVPAPNTSPSLSGGMGTAHSMGSAASLGSFVATGASHMTPVSPSTSQTIGAQFRAASLRRMTQSPGVGSRDSLVGTGGTMRAPSASVSPGSTRSSGTMTIPPSPANATSAPTMTSVSAGGPAQVPNGPSRLPPRTPTSVTGIAPTPTVAGGLAGGARGVANAGGIAFIAPSAGSIDGHEPVSRRASRFNFTEPEASAGGAATDGTGASPPPRAAPPNADVPQDITAAATGTELTDRSGATDPGTFATLVHTGSQGAMTTISEHSGDGTDAAQAGVGVLGVAAVDAHANAAAGESTADATGHLLSPDDAAGDGDGDDCDMASLVTHPLTEHEVFLGGACNPTVWRKSVAMPFLDAAGITYYNPQVRRCVTGNGREREGGEGVEDGGGRCQRDLRGTPFSSPFAVHVAVAQVDEWHPGLVVLEAKAKDEADVLLFVVGPETRAIASMIEVAELIASGRPVVLVQQDVPAEAEINGRVRAANLHSPRTTRALTTSSLPLPPACALGQVQKLPPDEIKDLNRGRAYLANVADRHGITAYASLDAGLAEVQALVLRKRAEVAQALALEALIQRRLSGAEDDMHFEDDDHGDASDHVRSSPRDEVDVAAVHSLTRIQQQEGGAPLAAPSSSSPVIATSASAGGVAPAAPPPPPLPVLSAAVGLGRSGRRHQPRESVITAISTVTSLDADESDRALLLHEEEGDSGDLDGSRDSSRGPGHDHTGSVSSQARSLDDVGALSSRSASGTHFTAGPGGGAGGGGEGGIGHAVGVGADGLAVQAVPLAEGAGGHHDGVAVQGAKVGELPVGGGATGGQASTPRQTPTPTGMFHSADGAGGR